MDKPNEEFVDGIFERRSITEAEARQILKLIEYVGEGGKLATPNKNAVSLFLMYCEWVGGEDARELPDFDNFLDRLSTCAFIVDLNF
jgi:hypothetical protein